MSPDELANRFEYHPPKDDETRGAHEYVRQVVYGVAVLLDKRVPESREKSLMMTHLEEALMWANAAIARNE
ncbi:Acb2/Tad1 domain-containing protein [Nonomuraea recticatena]|uniref:Acb2/Tad1 hairpin domain-containing protein n=1 Tax=Nonomuraea recticatena TaxID=46178 RepID=A0ABP6EEL7_9ACTN